MLISRCRAFPLPSALGLALLTACAPDQAPSQGEPLAVASLIDEWPQVEIDEPQAPPDLPAQAEIRFDGGGIAGVTWEPVSGVVGLEVRDGLFVGRTTGEPTAILFTTPEGLGAGDELWAIEIRLRAAAGGRVAFLPLLPEGGPEIKDLLTGPVSAWPISSPLAQGDGVTRYTVKLSQVLTLGFPMATTRFSSFLVRPTEAVDVEFAIESIRFMFRKEHLATIPSGPGWHGLGEVYRETLISRAPEALTFQVELPLRPWLDLAVGSIETKPPTFRVSLVDGGGPAETVAELTPEKSGAWDTHRIALDRWAGRSVSLRLEAAAAQPGTLAFWGSPTIRNSVDPEAEDGPQAVVVFLADTLRRDHLEAWGRDRETAPNLTRLAAEGVRFEDAIAQSTWTKGSVPSILTSLYPSTTGIVNINDRISAAETTLAEIFREAGYATFATSSIPFTGQLTNLHQGVEVMYEVGANKAADGTYHSKTSTVWVDKYLAWLEVHRDVPTFALVHAMDPHSPFEPPEPYDTLWTDEEDAERFAGQVEAVTPHIRNPMLRRLMMPSREELKAAGVDEKSFLVHEKAWYDGSIRLMDTNLGRILERLEALGLRSSALLSVVSDHGEEFLEHGFHWHGLTVYGEVANVPLIFWGRGVPPGVTVAETVQTIDLLPTLAELAGLEAPQRAQGRSLVPLFTNAKGTRPVPAFTSRLVQTEQRLAPGEPEPYAKFSIVEDGWKLVWNVDAPEAVAEFELFDHGKDPLNQQDLADSNPEVVERLAISVRRFKVWAEEQKLDENVVQSEISAEEMEQLRSLGYVD